MKIRIHDLRPEVTPTQEKASSLNEELAKNNRKVGPFELIEGKYLFFPSIAELNLPPTLAYKINKKLETLNSPTQHAIVWDTAIMYDSFVVTIIHGLWRTDVSISLDGKIERLPIDVSAENHIIVLPFLLSVRFSDFEFYFKHGRFASITKCRYFQTPNKKRLERIKSFLG